jgi:hypothetical protein
MGSVEAKILVAIVLVASLIAVTILIKRFRQHKSLDVIPFIDDLQSALFAILGLIIAGSVSVSFDSWTQGKIGTNSY